MESSNSSKRSMSQVAPRLEHFFTWFNYSEENLKKFIDFCEFKCSKYAFQEERCPTTGNLHLQGVLKLHVKARDTSFGLPKEIHWEKVHDESKALRYCLKDYTRVGRQWTKGVPKPVLDPMEGLELRPWQEEILELIAQPVDSRKIYWYWDPKGNTGKTTFTKHLCLKHNAVFLSGKPGDLLYSVSEALEGGKEVPLIIFGFPRDKEEFIAYGAMEQVKDGMFFSGKYEAKMCIFNPPHLLVFANFPPDTDKMSADRWVIREISTERDFSEYFNN